MSVVTGWIERKLGFETITYPFDGPSGVKKAVTRAVKEEGAKTILRAEWEQGVGVTIIYNKRTPADILSRISLGVRIVEAS